MDGNFKDRAVANYVVAEQLVNRAEDAIKSMNPAPAKNLREAAQLRIQMATLALVLDTAGRPWTPADADWGDAARLLRMLRDKL